MPVAGMSTPLRPATFRKLLLNAGVLLSGFDPSSYTTSAALKTALAIALADDTKRIGATRGGGTFNIAREMRQVEADGVRYRFVGDTYVDSADAYLSATLIETGNPAIMKKAMGNAELSTSGSKSVIKMRTRIMESDYMTNLCWVGDVADGGFVVIKLANAINTTDLTLTFTDKGEATLPVEFHAYQSSVEDYDYAPFELIYLDAATYTEVSSPTGNPKTQGYYELVTNANNGQYVPTNDTTVDSDKTYYTVS